MDATTRAARYVRASSGGRSADGNHLPRVALLEADPDLGEGLDASSVVELRRTAVAAVWSLDTGCWHGAGESFDPRGHLGLFVLEGILTRDVLLAGTGASELLGVGDLLRPWDDDEFASVPVESTWRVLEPTRLAVLDHRFAATVSRWPEFIAALMSRYVRRSRWLALQVTISHKRRVDARLLVLFWNMADRWGRARRDGVFVAAPLTHELLGRLVGAQRPSVTTALNQLAERGLVLRQDDGWLLRHGDPREDLSRYLADSSDSLP